MIHYVVSIEVGEDLGEKFEEYMRLKHIPEVLSTGKFVRALMFRSAPGIYRIDYAATDRESLEEYLAEYTERFREKFAIEFPYPAKAEREILEEIAVLEPDQS